MKKFTIMLVSSAFAMGLAGCAQPGEPGITAAQGGTVVGGVAGGVIGSQIGAGTGQVVSTIGGTLLGAFIGNRIGAAMDQRTVVVTNEAADYAMSTGEPRTWSTPRMRGRIVPSKAYRSGRQMCRPFTTTVTMNGKTQNISGTACKTSRGRWVVRS